MGWIDVVGLAVSRGVGVQRDHGESTNDRAMAVGSEASSPFSASRSSSGTWSTETLTLPSSMVGAFEGVAWARPPRAWAVGFRSPSDYSSEHTLVAGWDGSAWHFVPSPNPSTANSFLAGIASPGGMSWAVGGYTNSSGVEQTLIEGSC
jgi:hypothetical protein